MLIFVPCNSIIYIRFYIHWFCHLFSCCILEIFIWKIFSLHKYNIFNDRPQVLVSSEAACINFINFDNCFVWIYRLWIYRLSLSFFVLISKSQIFLCPRTEIILCIYLHTIINTKVTYNFTVYSISPKYLHNFPLVTKVVLIDYLHISKLKINVVAKYGYYTVGDGDKIIIVVWWISCEFIF